MAGAEVTPVDAIDAHAAMTHTLGLLAEDHRLGRSGIYPDIALQFTTPDGLPAEEAELRAPGENEEFIGRSELAVSVSIGDEEPRPLGELVVTALAPNQGTGKAAPEDWDSPRSTPATSIPVSRDGIFSELHVSLGTLVPEASGTRVHSLVNHLRLLALIEEGNGGHIVRLGDVGQSEDFFRRTLAGDTDTPHPTFTRMTGIENGERVGRHTALFNPTDAAQLAGVLTVREQGGAEFLQNIMPANPMAGPGAESRVIIPRHAESTDGLDASPLTVVPPHPSVLKVS